MSMKEAFDAFFAEMDNNSMKKFGELPSIPYIEGIVSKDLLVLDTLKNGYVVWRPELQKEHPSFDNVEKELGFIIHPQIKEYLTTYWFRRLEAKINVSDEDINFALDGMLPGKEIDDRVRGRLCTSDEHYLSNTNFLLGTYCRVRDNDGYLVCVNNETCEVSAVDVGNQVSIKLANNIEELLFNMKGIWNIND